MSEKYISVETAIALAMQYCPDNDGVCSKSGHDLRELLDDLENTAPADVRPVKQGEWMMMVDSMFNGERFVEWTCSECGYVRNRGWRHTNDGKSPDAKFCENCGADMRTIGQRLSDISAEEDLFPELTAEEKAENKAEAKRMIGGADG